MKQRLLCFQKTLHPVVLSQRRRKLESMSLQSCAIDLTLCASRLSLGHSTGRRVKAHYIFGVIPQMRTLEGVVMVREEEKGNCRW